MPSGMISIGVAPARGLSVVASRSVSATTTCTLDMTIPSNRSQARSSSPPVRRASQERWAVRSRAVAAPGSYCLSTLGAGQLASLGR